MIPNLEEMSAAELRVLKRETEKALANYELRQKERARKELEGLAHSLGYALSDFLSDAPSKRRAGKDKPVRYRKPGHPDMTWTGRGRRPTWVQEHLRAGGTFQEIEAA